MLKSLARGALLGGLTAFLWSFVSYGVLSWHLKQYHSFQNEDDVSALVSSHAPESGIYLLPLGPSQVGMNSEQKKAAMEIRSEKIKKGPLVFAAINREGFDSFPRVLFIQLGYQIFAALLLTWLLLQTTGLSYARRVAFLAIAGLAASVIADLPYWNWYSFPATYAAINLIDYTLTWLIAGLVIARLAKPQTASVS